MGKQTFTAAAHFSQFSLARAIISTAIAVNQPHAGKLREHWPRWEDGPRSRANVAVLRIKSKKQKANEKGRTKCGM
jgi:hypothetical protein